MDFHGSNGSIFNGGNGFPRPMLTRAMGQAEAPIPTRPASVASAARSIPLEVWPLALGVGMLAGGFAVKSKDVKTVLFGLGSTLSSVSTVALFAKL